MPTEKEYRVSTSPKEVLKENPIQPEQVYTYTTNKPLEYIPYVGILTHIDGATYPRKGNPLPLSVHFINIIKQLIKETLKHKFLILFVNKEKLLRSFNTLVNKMFSPLLLGEEFRPKEEYLCKASFSLMMTIDTFLTSLNMSKDVSREFAYNFALLVEYDDAYRYRMQDIISESSLYELKTNPRKEVKRLLSILHKRESPGDGTAGKITNLISPLLLLLLIPRFRNAFIRSAPFIIDCKYDDSDRYWACLKGDNYKFTGRTADERIEGLEVPKVVMVQL